jgi:N6-L-threonylcarbamoyladenine synthase
MKKRYILAIDTSCDDTSAAITKGTVIQANVIASQTQLHKQYGGVFPTVAKQAHKENIEATVQEALTRARIRWQDLAAVAVTQGPGLAPALEVGITYAKQAALDHQLPLLPVNHIEGHALSPLAERATRLRSKPQPLNLPALSLVISGGHSEFIRVNQIGEYERLGWTVDDAAGEVLDKVGRMLNLGYPAGPVIEKFAEFGDAKAFTFPLPMTTSGNYNLSFSGLKTAARTMIEKLEAEDKLDRQTIYNFCASFQYAVFRAICYKLDKILVGGQLETQFQEVWLGGGVAANVTLRKMIRDTIKPYHLKLRVPFTKRLCMDNAAMIGVVAGFALERGEGITDAAQVAAIERQPRLNL